MPKDIVPGDFFWLKESENTIFVALRRLYRAWSPGAMMTILGTSLLNRIYIDPKT